MNTLPLEVRNSFNEVFSAIEKSKNEIDSYIVDLAVLNDYRGIAAVADLGSLLQNLPDTMRSHLQLSEGTEISKGEYTTRSKKNLTRSSPVAITVCIAGTIIPGKNTSEKFVEAIKFIGVERIEPLGISIGCVPLISRKPSNSYHRQTEYKGTYINKQVGSEYAKKILEGIGCELGIDVMVFSDKDSKY